MDSKKQMYLRLFFNKSFQTHMLSNIMNVVADHLSDAEVSVNGQAYVLDIKPKGGIIEQSPNRYSDIISVIVVDYVKRNYIQFRKLYDEYAYESKEFKEYITKDDIQILMNSDLNRFLFNVIIFQDTFRVTFR